MEHIKKNITEYFKDLTFNEEEHKYFVNGKPINFSVSGIIKKYEEPFKADSTAERVALRTGKTKYEILAEWRAINKQSLIIGNAAHLFGEQYVFDRTIIPQDGYQEAIAKFWNDLPDYIIPVCVETRMYHKERFYAGTMDIFLYNTLNDTFIIADYKTNKDLFKNFAGKKLRGKFSDLLDTPYSKYEIQLSYYQELIEQVPGIKISKRKIIWVKPTGEYELFDCVDYTERIAKRIKFNKRWS